MNSHVRDCLVSGYEDLIPGLALPDPDDGHVLAAAIHAGADTIVTYNVDDFPTEALAEFAIEAQHPDAFIMRLVKADLDAVCAAARRQRQNLKRPPVSVEAFLAALERQKLLQTTAVLRQFAERL
jgi:hypothetical protein